MPGSDPGHSSLIPMAIGNTWTYVDSLLTDSTTSVDTFTVSIMNDRIDSQHLWWEFHDSRIQGTFLIELAMRNDSVFSLQSNEDSSVISLEYIPPPETDTLRYVSIFDGKAPVEKSVFLLEGSCPVPAGTFDRCAVYSWLESPLGFIEILKPGVGMVRTQFSTSTGEHRISLLQYAIAE